MTELEHLESKIREDQRQCKRIRKEEKNQQFAEGLRSLYDSLLASGFSEGQAFGLLIEAAKACWNS